MAHPCQKQPRSRTGNSFTFQLHQPLQLFTIPSLLHEPKFPFFDFLQSLQSQILGKSHGLGEITRRIRVDSSPQLQLPRIFPLLLLCSLNSIARVKKPNVFCQSPLLRNCHAFTRILTRDTNEPFSPNTILLATPPTRDFLTALLKLKLFKDILHAFPRPMNCHIFARILPRIRNENYLVLRPPLPLLSIPSLTIEPKFDKSVFFYDLQSFSVGKATPGPGE